MTHTHILAAIISAALGVASLHAAEDASATGGEAHKHEKGNRHDHDKKKVSVEVPATAEALWAEIDKQRQMLGTIITEKKADDLHETSEKLEALVAAVPSKYPDAAADKRKRAEGGAKNIARVLDALHEEGEEGHWDAVTKKLAQVDSALTTMKAQLAK